jgi:hypothetical protein
MVPGCFGCGGNAVLARGGRVATGGCRWRRSRSVPAAAVTGEPAWAARCFSGDPGFAGHALLPPYSVT